MPSTTEITRYEAKLFGKLAVALDSDAPVGERRRAAMDLIAALNGICEVCDIFESRGNTVEAV